MPTFNGSLSNTWLKSQCSNITTPSPPLACLPRGRPAPRGPHRTRHPESQYGLGRRDERLGDGRRRWCDTWILGWAESGRRTSGKLRSSLGPPDDAPSSLGAEHAGHDGRTLVSPSNTHRRLHTSTLYVPLPPHFLSGVLRMWLTCISPGRREPDMVAVAEHSTLSGGLVARAAARRGR